MWLAYYVIYYYRMLAKVRQRGVPLKWSYRVRLAWAYAKMVVSWRLKR